MLMASCWELTWRTLRGTSHTPSTRHLRWQTRLISTDSLSENTVAPRAIPSCIIGIVNSQEIHGCWMCFVLSLSWAESMINQKRFLNSVLSSLLIFFKLKVKLPLRLTAIGIVEVIEQNFYCSRDIYLQWRKYYRSDTVFLEMRKKFKCLLRTDYIHIYILYSILLCPILNCYILFYPILFYSTILYYKSTFLSLSPSRLLIPSLKQLVKVVTLSRIGFLSFKWKFHSSLAEQKW